MMDAPKTTEGLCSRLCCELQAAVFGAEEFNRQQDLSASPFVLAAKKVAEACSGFGAAIYSEE